MGDRTSVTLTVLNEHVEKVKEIADYFDYDFPGSTQTHCIQFYEVNYGELDFLDQLKYRGIPFNNEWDAGNDYGPGTISCRFTSNGELVWKEISDSALNPPLSDLVSLINFPDKLIEYILEYKEKVSILPWDNQAEYGRIYAALNMITPKT